MPVRIGFVGAGKMAEAMLAGLIRRGAVAPGDLLASDVSAERLQQLGARLGIGTTAENAAVPAFAPTVFLAVKPQQLDAVLAELAPRLDERHLLLSIAAGKRLERLEALAPRARVIRVMPNLPCTVGEGMSAFARGARATPADAAAAAELLGCFGRALEVRESALDAVTALSGSGPAFFAYLLDSLARAAEAEGLARNDALLLAEQTMLGTARLLLDQGLAPADLAAAVTSARGTTAAGREVLENGEVARLLAATLRAAAARSRELSRV